MEKNILNTKGSIIVGVLITMVVLIGSSIALISLVISLSIGTQRSYQVISALSLAEAGVEKTMWELNSNRTISCTSLCTFSTGQFEVTVTDVGTSNKIITSTGYVPNKANYKVKRIVQFKIKASPSSEGIAFNYALQAGTGGINVSGSSEVNGNLYSNGNISVSGSGEVEDPGNVWAVGTITDSKNGIKGTKHPGATPKPLPTVDANLWQTLAKNGGTLNGNYSPPSTGNYTDLGPEEITGDVSMSSSNQKINLKGPVYIHGNLTISGGKWKVDNSFGTKGTIVLVDGLISVSGGAKFTSNASGAFILFISMNSSDNAISYNGSADSQNLALYAYNGGVSLSGSGEIVAMTGKTLNLSGSGEIIYKSGLASSEFSGGPGGNWIKDEWEEKTK